MKVILPKIVSTNYLVQHGSNIPRELQYLITNYNHESIFSLPLEHLWDLNWNLLLRDNFGYEGLVDLSTIDLICLYLDRCQQKKFIFCGSSSSYVRIGNIIMRGRSAMSKAAIPLPNRDVGEIEEIVINQINMFVRYKKLSDGSRYQSAWGIRNW